MEFKIGNFQNYIGGIWCDSENGEYMDQANPADGEIVSRVQKSTVNDVRKAATCAAEAFVKADWAFNPRKRAAALYAWAERLKQNQNELARMLTLETGKPLREARGEIMGAIGYLQYYAAAARTLYGTSTAVDQYSYSILAREPVGVIAVIVPWNYPVTLLMRDLAPALAAGNAAVVKAATQTSGVTMACIKLMEDITDFPKGILNAITGSGKTVGTELSKSEAVNMVQFTGSSETGKEIMREASNTMKKLSLELGGKSASIIFEDADLKKALPFAISSIFTNAGQLCTSASRLLVQESIAPHVIEELKNRAESLKVGNGLDEQNDMGAITIESQMNKILKYINIGKQDGKILTGGMRLLDGGLKKGFFIAPTIILDLPFNSPVVQEEIFGPVLTVHTFKTEDEAVEMANGTVFGLASGVWSQNINRAMRVARRMRAGTTWVNTYNRLLNEAETGGYKESGIGRSGGAEGLFKFTEVKHICVDFTPIA